MKILKLFFLSITFLFFTGILHSQKLIVGEDVEMRLESPHPYPAKAVNTNFAWTQEISYTATKATYVAIHFSKFDLAEGDKLILRSPDNSRSWEYTSADNTRGEFWSIPIYGNKAIIEIESNNSKNSYGYSIDRIARGYTQAEVDLKNDTRSICGNDDSEEAKCYQVAEPAMYDNSRAVARLWLNGSINCTGWLVGDEGHLMTCNHCIGSTGDANNTSVEMMAEGATCATNCQTLGACPGTMVASSVTMTQTNCALDYTMVELPDNVSDTYGFLSMKEDGPALDEQIYIPQHPAGWGKRIAFVSDNANDPDGLIRVHTLTENSCWCGGGANRVGYFGDTRGGSSGSPVISYEDHCVVAVHGCGGCPNDGANTALIIADLTYIPNNAVCGQEPECGDGPDIDINGYVTYNTNMEIPGNIIIHPGAQLTVTSQLKFGKNKAIAVLQGGKLIVDGGHLTRCDNAEDWRGIVVEGFSGQAQPSVSAAPASGQAGIVHIRNNSLVEWTRTAISTNYWGSWTNSKWGGLVVCENSDFYNNNRVAEFMKYDLTNSSKFHNCTMDGNTTINGTTVGVTIWDTDGVTFNQNRFYNMEGEGLLTYDAGAIVKDGNDFHHNRRGISNRATYPFAAYLEVGDLASDPNYFFDNWFHIESYGSNKLGGLKIINNEFFDANSALWLRGPNKFFVEHNSFANSTGGAVCLYTGAMNANQHNYVRKNYFNTSSGVTAYGRNRELQILCNEFSNTWDIRVTQDNSGSQPGEIRMFQGSFGGGADNCFTQPVNQGDINTVGWTTAFNYYHRNTDPCLIPTTPGNYTPLNAKGSSCTKGPILEYPPDQQDWVKVLDDINAYIAANDIDNPDYFDLLELREAMLIYFVDDNLKNANFEQALGYLSQVDEEYAKMATFGIWMNQGDFEQAEIALHALDSEIPEMNDFKEIQFINMNRLKNMESFELAPSDQAYLEELAVKDYGVSAYARSILGLVAGIEYLDQFSIDDPSEKLLNTKTQKFTQDISLSPNPTDGKVSIAIPQEMKDLNLQIQIVDLNGKVMKNSNVIGREIIDYDISKLNSGLYLLRITSSEDNLEFVTKLIKQ